MGRARAVDSFLAGTEGEVSEQDPALVLTLARGLQVMKCFTNKRPNLSNKEIAQLTGLSKPTVSRLTYTLSRYGYLRYSPSLLRYSLGLSLLAATHPLLSHMKIRQVARPLMQEMANEVGGAVSIGMQFGSKMIYVESCASASSVNPVVAGVGARIPLYRTAMGRAYICGLTSRERDGLLGTITPGWNKPGNEHLADVEDALAQYKKWGFCLAAPNLTRETRSVGVPLQVRVEEDLYAFNCGVPVYRLDEDQIQTEIGPRLMQLVRDVEISLGLR